MNKFINLFLDISPSLTLYHGTWADTMVTFEVPRALYAHNMAVDVQLLQHHLIGFSQLLQHHLIAYFECYHGIS